MIPFFGDLVSGRQDNKKMPPSLNVAFSTTPIWEWDISVSPPEDIGKPILVDETEYSNRLVRTYTYSGVLENKVFLSIGYYKKSKYRMPPEVVWNVTKYIHHETFTDSFRNRERPISKLEKEFDEIWALTRKTWDRPETLLSLWTPQLHAIFVNAGIMPSSAHLHVIDPNFSNIEYYKKNIESKIMIKNKGRLDNFVLRHTSLIGRPNIFDLYFPHIETTVQRLANYDSSIKVPNNLFPNQPVNIMNGMTFQQLKDAGFQIG